jgi:group I intron endonuclease
MTEQAINCIYVYINRNDNKMYIGMAVDFKDRDRRHRKDSFNPNNNAYNGHFHNAIRKYGWDSFDSMILEENLERDILPLQERFWIAIAKALDIELYNMTDGGEGTFGRKTSQETRDKMSKAKLGKKLTEEHKRNAALAKVGIPQSEETKAKRRSAMIGKNAGENAGRAKLDWVKVREIRRLVGVEKRTQEEVRHIFGISVGNISAIINYHTWKE